MIYQPRIEQSDWSEVTSHGTSTFIIDDDLVVVTYLFPLSNAISSTLGLILTCFFTRTSNTL